MSSSPDNTALDAAIAALCAPLFAADAPHGVTLAMMVMVDGRIAHQRYGVRPANVFQAQETVTADTALLSWSMAKSITHAAIGIAAADGLVEVDAPAPVPVWRGTPKQAITVRHLLAMRSGLAFVEEYEDGLDSDCLAMLFGCGQADMAAYAASKELLHPPGSVWNYSSGTTNILCSILGRALAGAGQDITAYLDQRLFAPAGMGSATITTDAAGTFIGSSYVHATAGDFARFGELYRLGGTIAGRRILEPAWVGEAATFSAADPDNGLHYGQHWWMLPSHPGSLAAVGYEGQYIIVVPQRRLTLVHLGKVPAETRPLLLARIERIIAECPTAAAGVG